MGLLFRCLLPTLPMLRITKDDRGEIPRTARSDGMRLVASQGTAFEKFMREKFGRGPGEASLVDFVDALYQYFWPKLATSSQRTTLCVEGNDSFRECDLTWPDFWINERELRKAVCEAVRLYSMARNVAFSDVSMVGWPQGE